MKNNQYIMEMDVYIQQSVLHGKNLSTGLLWQIGKEKMAMVCIFFVMKVICAGLNFCAPYKHKSVSSQEGIFSTKIDNLRKDIECVFGILTKQ
jgi:hypothetical protein